MISTLSCFFALRVENIWKYSLVVDLSVARNYERNFRFRIFGQRWERFLESRFSLNGGHRWWCPVEGYHSISVRVYYWTLNILNTEKSILKKLTDGVSNDTFNLSTIYFGMIEINPVLSGGGFLSVLRFHEIPWDSMRCHAWSMLTLSSHVLNTSRFCDMKGPQTFLRCQVIIVSWNTISQELLMMKV